MNRAAILGGTALMAASTALAAREIDTLAPWERRMFGVVNGAPDGLRPMLWPLMQLGNGLMAVAVPAVVISATRPDPAWELAATGGAAALGGWQLAKGVKRLAQRGRPAAFVDDVKFRDGVPDGLGFVSGHTTVAAAVAAVLSPRLRPSQRAAAWGLAATVGFARIYVGAHLPLDIVGGFGLGAAWGGLLATDHNGASK